MMTITRTILTVTIALLSTSAWAIAVAAGVPITFARSGQAELVEVAVAKGKPTAESVVLAAFGRVWTKPAQVKNDAAKIKVPTVRVPTVFHITAAKDAKRTFGELVAYPDQAVKWNKKIILYSAGAPKWFNQWAEAVGLPVKKVNLAEFKTVNQQKSNDKKYLLILGRKTAGKDFWDTLAIAQKHKINVLVLNADWFGDKSGKVTVQPKQMADGLAELRKQKWSKPLTFGSHRKPWQGITNRCAWIVDKNGLPLVEEVAPTRFLFSRVVISYLPWQYQLGRHEQAEELLVTLLKTSASLEKLKDIDNFHPYRPVEIYMIHPSLKKVKLKYFPVRPAVLACRYSIIEPESLSVLDLRGTGNLPVGLLDKCRKIENCIGPRKGHKDSRLLILGDDKMLNNWKWLKLDRAKKTTHRPGVIWLSNDELPLSKDNQVILMLKLTELGLPLKDPKPLKQEKENEEANE